MEHGRKYTKMLKGLIGQSTICMKGMKESLSEQANHSPFMNLTSGKEPGLFYMIDLFTVELGW